MSKHPFIKIVCYVPHGQKVPVLVVADCTDCVAEIGFEAVEQNICDKYATHAESGDVLALGLYSRKDADRELKHCREVIEALSEAHPTSAE